jgi:hypothetical protein
VDSLLTKGVTTESSTHRAEIPRGVWILRLLMAVFWTLAILVLCWLPRELVNEVEGESSFFEIPYLDKFIHWGVFAAFAVLWLRVGGSRHRYAWVALAGGALAAVTEIVQQIPSIGRDAELADFAIDLFGVLIGIGAARWVEPLLRRVESRLFGG